MSGFNLIYEKWIPCIHPGGITEPYGLRDVLVEAHTLREVHDPSPLVTAALHRLLLAILHRIFGPDTEEEWHRLWQAGRFDLEPLDTYFDSWHSRFYLFDEHFPFYQVAGFQTRGKTPLKRLAFEYAVQHNVTLFDHSSDSVCPAYPAAQAARWLVASQNFYPSAGKSVTIHTKDSPWSRGAAIIADGTTLFETLMFNLVPLSLRNEVIQPPGIPSWEESQPTIPEHGAIPKGYLEYLTWQSRVIRLIPEVAADGNTVVSECCLGQGKSVVDEFHHDPLLAYKKTAGKGIKPWQLSENRAVWRDSHSLLSRSADLFIPSRNLELLSRLTGRGVLTPGQVFHVSVYGQCLEPGQPKIHFWRHERMPLPLAYLSNQDYVNDLAEALGRAERAANALRVAVWHLAAGLSDDEDSRRNLARHLKATELFWSRLERPFYETLVEIPQDPDRALDSWDHTLRGTVWCAFNQSTRGLDHSARTLKALENAHGRLARSLVKVLPKEVTHD